MILLNDTPGCLYRATERRLYSLLRDVNKNTSRNGSEEGHFRLYLYNVSLLCCSPGCGKLHSAPAPWKSCILQKEKTYNAKVPHITALQSQYCLKMHGFNATTFFEVIMCFMDDHIFIKKLQQPEAAPAAKFQQSSSSSSFSNQ